MKKFKNYTASTRNQITCGLKFFYNETLKRDDMVLRLPRKRPQKKLPEILGMDEVARLLQAPPTSSTARFRRRRIREASG